MGNGRLKNDEKSVNLATPHVVLYPAPAGIHVATSNFGWPRPSVAWSPMGRPTEAIVRPYRENSGYREKWSQTLGAWAGAWSPDFVCQGQPSNFGRPWPSCGCLWWSTHASQVGGSFWKTLVYGEWGLEKWRKIRYSGYNAYGVVSRSGLYSRCRIELWVNFT